MLRHSPILYMITYNECNQFSTIPFKKTHDNFVGFSYVYFLSTVISFSLNQYLSILIEQNYQLRNLQIA